MNPDELAEVTARIRAEVPEGALDVAQPPGAAPLETYVEALRKNPNWRALEEVLVEDAASLLWGLASMDPAKDESNADFQRRLAVAQGIVRGMMRVIEAPRVTRRAIEARRDRQ